MSAAACDGLVCDQLGVGLPGQPLLATVHARLQAGRVSAILGPNGAGKSTLLAVLSGARAPRSGSVHMQGQPLGRFSAQELASRRAVLLQEASVAFDFTVREVVEMGRFPHRAAPSRQESAIVVQAMEATGVAHLAERSLNALSGGERARTHLARALAQIWEPRPDRCARWLLLDEPTAALDLAHQHQSLGLVRRWALEQGVGVLVVLHDLNLALRYAHDTVLLGGGQCAVGPTEQVLDAAAIARVWGVECSGVRARDGVLQYLTTAQ
ncbi:heme ABC transporter ATP-binding protein [Verminephrobacter aporrectodeae]|uniref:heme ABC transporter ATP-binding protein n=1 Tax=Verminephrobacter aporrectodeae TaxID=1110389 RepID=UPI002244A2DA|nr:heme ABC transporter ATP-binding protein [Verminephrobacter aporrectodeae]MCW8174889.1 heme ABC transporter ATP-binding protein [Verminephrobacter aporrectodeae subsp. tuberculatae]MCW8202909.1 heme ABC transporter ATP-binding protein [Verminephrobacter aporrectodeae subsp. tuberculatae]